MCEARDRCPSPVPAAPVEAISPGAAPPCPPDPGVPSPGREEPQWRLLSGSRAFPPGRGTGRPVWGREHFPRRREGSVPHRKQLLWPPPLAKPNPQEDVWEALSLGG